MTNRNEEAWRATRPVQPTEALIAVLEWPHPLWAAEGVRFVADLAVTPSPALAEAVRRRLDAYARARTEQSRIVTYDGDKRLDYNEVSNLRDALKAARRLADVSRADLRPQIDALRRAVVLYPKSEMASRFPRGADEASRYITTRLAP